MAKQEGLRVSEDLTLPISRAQLAEDVGMESSGGGFAARLSETRSTGLLIENRGEVAVNPELLFL